MAIGALITKVSSRSMLALKRRSPEILICVGIASLVGSTALACRATLKYGKIKEDHKIRLTEIEEVKKLSSEYPDDPAYSYTDEDVKHDKMVSIGIMIREYAMAYGPSIFLGAIGIFCIIKSRNILQNRNLALVSAYNLVSNGFELYRKRVKDELGADMDHHFRYGTIMEEKSVVNVSEDGKKEKIKEIEHFVEGPTLNGSVYSRIFDSKCINWANHDDYNWTFIRAKQDYFNFLLNRDGVIFLNDVYEGLGFPRTRAGQVVGWSNKGKGDGVVKITIKTLRYRGSEAPNVDAKALLLSFNVDGVVYYNLDREA